MGVKGHGRKDSLDVWTGRARARRLAQRPFELAFFDTGPGVRVLRFDWPNKCYKLPRGDSIEKRSSSTKINSAPPQPAFLAA